MVGFKDFKEEEDHTIVLTDTGLVNFIDFDGYNVKKP